ncbi:Soluble ligand binding domain-containing protein [Caldithrix abyssi DSM 13497]|uniref:Protein involved in polysaccharide export, contains SLBB domain of the beta-grasp fold n=1 Tax=Caldithrix abyssi DSM 13497 TaxID=880073 RepID=H1XS92_CALAY|nr:SLBB domain-containing protein [Caldithrix abyssi]APF20198.1 protein involved in polysaccharide export, contains SLBB domain of the beta-grasp fold [Caldithrix abyssi DSM 13497]EHO40256.1 Soluble ligand binding domain-containing protein [Caldithrix abyssi DSM 13497]
MKTVLSIFFIIWILSSGFAQDIPTLQENILLDRENPKYQTSLEKFYKQRSITRTISPQVLEAEIEDSLYMVGPGDQLGIHVFGEIEIDFLVTVSPEGVVVIPTIGTLNIGKLSLKEAKEKLKDFINTNYHASTIHIDLISMRKFRVYLVGEVANPGTYFAQATDRVSDIIEVGGGLKDWADETNIQIHHRNGRVDTLDILRFYAFGDKDNNPTVDGGDVIYVPAIDLNSPHVIVEWNKEEINETMNTEQFLFQTKYKRKIYRIINNETLIEFLERIAILDNQVELEHIIVKRAGEEISVDLFDEYNKEDKFILKKGDALIVPDIVDKVYVQGEVLNPGAYPYQVNLTANDYIGMSGILEKSKTGSSILVIRAKSGKVLKGGNVIVNKGDIVVVPRKTRESIRDYLSILTPMVSIIISTYSLYLTISKK